MLKQGLEEYARLAVERDSRYDAGAYLFLRDALEHTLRGLGKSREGTHVCGPELLAGFRDLALQEFGPLAITVLDCWGVRRCEDVGAMVFNLVDAGAFGRTQEDSPEDFAGGYEFTDAFVKPFQPGNKPAAQPPAGTPRRARGSQAERKR